MEESRIETRLRNKAKNLGGLALKLSVPGKNGMPDRIILLPGGQVRFVELKKPGGKLEKLQRKRAKMLRAMGFKVYCLDSVRAVDDFIREVFE